MAKHYGWKILEKRETSNGWSFRRMAKTGKFQTRAGAEAFVAVYKKQHPEAELSVVEDIRGAA